MTVYVIDTNLLFSAAIKPNNRIGQFIFEAPDYGITLIAPAYLKVEIELHFNRMVKVARLPPTAIRELLNLLYEQITFVADHLTPIAHYALAASLLRDIDERDVAFVALSSYRNACLLTGDFRLSDGLLSKGYTKVITFKQIAAEYNLY